MSDPTTLYEKCIHGRLEAHGWYPHDYTNEFSTEGYERLVIAGKWDGGYWCPGGRERTFETYLAEVQLPGRFAEFIDVLVEVTDEQ